MSILFTPLKIGDLELPNRIIMAPLTRCRASTGRIPNKLMAEYYSQRASAGLIISEATSVSPMGVGYPDTPGIWSLEQIEGWKLVTSAVHKAKGRIFLQLWHVGRISDPIYLDNTLPIAPSAIAAEGHVSLIRPKKNYVTPRAIATEEIAEIVKEFHVAAVNAKQAGFDGVEIHGANGYLIDQFLQSSTNHRTDQYGGSIENRVRFLLEVTDTVISVWGANKVGMHIAPSCDAHSMGDENPRELFTYVANKLRQRNLAYIFSRESQSKENLGPAIKRAFAGVYIINQGLTKEVAEEVINGGNADAASFGSLFIANPDLPKRFLLNSELQVPDPTTFYASGANGYTNYPTLL